MNKILITAPSLDLSQNVSGVSSVVRFIIENNPQQEYVHFLLGKRDNERGGVFRVSALVKAMLSWRRLLVASPDAIVHYSYPLSGQSVLRDTPFILSAHRLHHRMVVHVHGGVYLTAKKIPRLMEWLMRKVFAHDVPFIVLSDDEKQTLTSRFGAKHVEVLPNCPDLNDARTFTRQSPDVASPLRMGYLGRIEPNKGMSELLDACQRLKALGIPFVLDLAGKEQDEGEYLPLMAQTLGESFHYSGIVSGEEKAAYLRSLDVFVMPSYFEGLPMSLLECMSYGAVPVVTPVGSIPRVVADGENGLMIKQKDVDSIVESIARLHNDRPLLRRLGIKARKTIFDRFSVERYVEKLNKIYESL